MGLVYSLHETMARLGKTEEELKKLVDQSKLRESRDGMNLFFDADDVAALESQEDITTTKKLGHYKETDYGNGVWRIEFIEIGGSVDTLSAVDLISEALSRFCGGHPKLRITTMLPCHFYRMHHLILVT